MSLRTPFPHCPLCGGPVGPVIGAFDCSRYPHYSDPLPKTLTWVQCGACGHVHTDGFWTAEGLAILLSQVHASQIAEEQQVDDKRLLWAETVRQVQSHLPAPDSVFADTARWLDVGCGDGTLVMVASEFGFDAAGIDTRNATVERLQSFGYRAIEADFLSAASSQPLDVVSMADVLEHLPYPLPALQKAHGMLKPAGLLYVSAPNMDCIAWRAMDRRKANPYWIELEHHHNFSRRLLMAALRRCGFAPFAYGVSRRYKAGMEIIARKV